MLRFASLTLAVALVVALALPHGVALGQTRQLPEKGNRWGSRAHQPTQRDVTQQEQSAGIARSPQQQRATNNELEGLGQKLTNAPQH
jgi:uncharacterized protein HemX